MATFVTNRVIDSSVPLTFDKLAPLSAGYLSVSGVYITRGSIGTVPPTFPQTAFHLVGQDLLNTYTPSKSGQLDAACTMLLDNRASDGLTQIVFRPRAVLGAPTSRIVSVHGGSFPPGPELIFCNRDQEVLRMTNTGNVGIGTTVPTEKLTVIGNISAAGTITANQIIGLSGTFGGNAATAAALQTSRNLWGQSFDGTADITGSITTTGNVSAAGNIIANSFSGNVNATNIANGSVNNNEFQALSSVTSDIQLQLDSKVFNTDFNSYKTSVAASTATLTPLTLTNTLTSQIVTDFNNYKTSVAGTTATLTPLTLTNTLTSQIVTTTGTLTSQLVLNTDFNNYKTSVAGTTATLTPITTTRTLTGQLVLNTDSRLTDARTPTSHTHGNITNGGAIGTTANRPIITTTLGVLTTGSFGSTANTFCQGNDIRLSDTRTPTDFSVTDAKVSTTAAISGTKINPNFGSQNIVTTGSVGIGTINPNQRLTVSGNINLNLPSDSWSSVGVRPGIDGNSTVGLLYSHGSFRSSWVSNGYRNSSTQWTSLSVNNQSGAAMIELDPVGDILFRTDANKQTGSNITVNERMRINSSGNVGIGTTNPNQRLTVSGNISATGSIDAGTQFLGRDADTASAPSFSWTGDTNTGMYRPAADTLGFVTNSTERLRMTSTVLSSRLDFLPGIDGTYDLGSSTLEWQDLWIDGTANIDSLVAESADINAGTIDNVSIGNTTAATLLKVDSIQIDGNTISSTNTNGNIIFDPNGSGNVGIDTTIPNQKLTVSGNISATNQIYGSVTALGTTTARTLEDRFADVVNIEDFGAKGNGTDETAIIQAALNSITRTLPNQFVLPIREVDFGGKTYCISSQLNIQNHPFTRFKNGALSAIGAWSSGTQYMINAGGASQLANMGIEIELGLYCEHKALGIYLENAYRARLNPRINRFKTVGIYVGNNVGLSKIDGILHEVEGFDSNFTTYPRSATGIWIGPGGGDLTVTSQIGWTHRCIYNEAGGPVLFEQIHIYCSSTSIPILGTIYEQTSDAYAVMASCYLDTGRIVYRGGYLHIDSDCHLFHLGGVTAPQLSAYIEMIPSFVNQYHLLTIDAPRRSDRNKPLIATVPNGANSWINVPLSLKQTYRDCFTRLDPFVFSTADNNDRPVAFDNKSTHCVAEFRDNNTTAGQAGPQLGSRGDSAIIKTAGSDRVTVNSSGNVGIGIASPNQKLTVVGNISATGFIDAGTQFLGRDADTVSAPSFSWTSDANTGMYRPAPDTLAFVEGGSEVMRIDSSGNTGIGVIPNQGWLTGSSASKLHVKGDNGDIYTQILEGSGNEYTPTFVIKPIDASGTNRRISTIQAHNENNIATISQSFILETNGESYVQFLCTIAGARNSDRRANAGTIKSGVGYTNPSDYRLKTNVQTLSSALSDICQLRPISYKFKSCQGDDHCSKRYYGFFAHEVQEIPSLAFAVDGQKDAVKENGDPKYQSLSYILLVPALTKAIQELKQQLDTANEKIAILEAKLS